MREPLFYVPLLITKLKAIEINSPYRTKWWLKDSFKLCLHEPTGGINTIFNQSPSRIYTAYTKEETEAG